MRSRDRLIRSLKGMFSNLLTTGVVQGMSGESLKNALAGKKRKLMIDFNKEIDERKK